MTKQMVIDWIDRRVPELSEASQKIWEFAEVGLREYRSAELLAGMLEGLGFSVKRGVAGMPTAFVAEYGEGGPVVGILGEYDALPGMSQEAVPRRKPRQAGAPGHACGHNLFGVASLAAAAAVKAAIEAGKVRGTIRFYGCPAEETLVGKIFMARAGLFDDCDAALAWHPMPVNAVWAASSLALNSVKFRFHGAAAHAAANPDMGRSALDAVELMNMGVNMLREHVMQEARIHYVITNGGGEPNVVPATAEVWYYVRAPKRHQVDAIYERVRKIAQGAALMTETTVTETFLTAGYDYLPNAAVGQAMAENLARLGGPGFTADEHAWAAELAKTFEPGQREAVMRPFGTDFPADVWLHDGVLPPFGAGTLLAGSTDVGDVSYITPTAQVVTACYPIGVAGHSWQLCASVATSVGVKGMVLAAKTMGLTAIDLLSDPLLVERAKAELARATAGSPYRCAVPADVPPPLDQFDH